jgi:pilus assembly protein Flp/PilA
MQKTILKLYVILQNLTSSEQGQDLVEYALLLTVISLSLITAIKGIASTVATVFTNVSTSLS